MVFVYTTCSTEEEAKRLSKLIIDKKLAACVDYWPISSLYNWENKFTERTQYMIMISTFESKIETINDLISEHHSYSIPLIGGVDVRRINRAYKEWMTQEIE